MTKYITGTRAECESYRTAIDQDAGLPTRATAAVRVDRAGVVRVVPYPLPLVYGGDPTPGWTSHICSAPIEVNAGQAALEVNADHEHRLGKRVGSVDIPPAASAKAVGDLPAPLRTKVHEKYGRDENGNHRPLGAGQGGGGGK